MTTSLDEISNTKFEDIFDDTNKPYEHKLTKSPFVFKPKPGQNAFGHCHGDQCFMKPPKSLLDRGKMVDVGRGKYTSYRMGDAENFSKDSHAVYCKDLFTQHRYRDPTIVHQFDAFDSKVRRFRFVTYRAKGAYHNV